MKRNASLPKSVFQAPRKDQRDKAFGSIIGGTQTTKWYSASPKLHAVQFLDLAMLEVLVSRPAGLNDLGKLGASMLLDHSHLLVRHVDTDDVTGWVFVGEASDIPGQACSASAS